MKYASAFVRRDEGRWFGVLKYKEGGKWRSKSHVLAATGKAAARRELAEWRTDMERRAADEDERASTTVPDYVLAFVDRLAAGEIVEASTVADYHATARRITSAFQGVVLRDLTPEAVQRWEAEMLRGGLSAATVGKAHRLLKQAMGDAVNLGIIARNPVGPVRPPKRKSPRPNALDLDGRTAVLAALDAMAATPITVSARLALYCGLREGEVCGLRWTDVDFADGTITVRRSIGRREGGTYVKTPKTERVRDVPVPADLAETLGSWRNVQTAQALRAGVTFPGDLYVTGRVDGAYYSPDILSREWRTLSKALDAKGTEGRIPTFHDLRHTFATCAIAEGVDVKTVSSILGHANAAMTLNVYASADPDAKRRAAKTINAAMRRKPAQVRRLDKAEA